MLPQVFMYQNNLLQMLKNCFLTLFGLMVNVKKTVLIQQIEIGEQKMPDIESMIKAMKPNMDQQTT